MTARRCPALAAAALLPILASHVLAAYENVLPGVRDGLKAFAADGKVRHCVIRVKVEAQGQTREQPDQEIWYQGDDRLRADLSTQNFVLAVSPEGGTLFSAQAGLALVARGEAFEKLGESAPDRQRNLGVNPPLCVLDRALAEEATLSIERESAFDGRDCWVMTVAPERLEAWSKIILGEQPVTLSAVHIGVDKQDFLVRGLDFTGTQFAPNGGPTTDFKVTLAYLGAENGVEVPESFFALELPEDAEVMEWRAGAKTEEMLVEFVQAVVRRLEEQGKAQIDDEAAGQEPPQ
ncbi:MAG TPA: hypothetical protein PLD23_16090 [Armatimonadota bacterium]|nr:hypothetical protein [Armatimonadota bacterium]